MSAFKESIQNGEEVDASAPMTYEECIRLRIYWEMLSEYEQEYFRSNAEAFLAWLRRQARDLFDKVAASISIEPDWFEQALADYLDDAKLPAKVTVINHLVFFKIE